jgi:glycosyltransferase involved in cell wall biosynthesis
MNETVGIVMPVYNEEKTVPDIVAKVMEQDCVHELVIVDDCSSDGTWEVLESLKQENRKIRIFRHEVNQGKGAALRTGFEQVSTDLVGIQDADMEYDPSEYGVLLAPFKKGVADVVYGSRFQGAGAHRVVYFWHSIGNRFLTLLSNMLSDINLTDMETCYKFFRRKVIQSIDIKENRFGFEPEITAKIAKIKGIRIYEVPISYYGRTYEEGKKIGWRDGFSALKCIIKYNLFG